MLESQTKVSMWAIEFLIEGYKKYISNSFLIINLKLYSNIIKVQLMHKWSTQQQNYKASTK